jgi:hypothetical protein
MRALNLGCGTKLKKPGEDGFDEWINADIREDVGADMVFDCTIGIPFPTGYFVRVHLDNVLEHFRSEEAIALINEVDRVIEVGGTVRVIVPHFQSQGSVQDWTHKSYWSPRNFLYSNQVTTPFGGRAIGITANLVAIEGPTVYGDMATEAFITVLLRKEPVG